MGVFCYKEIFILMKFTDLIYEMVLKEYNEKFLNQIIKKFQEEIPDLETDIIRVYINRFVQIKDSPNVKEKDITKYTWRQLESVVDSNQPKRIKTGKMNDGEPGGDSNLIYNENGLRIYLGKTKNACIKYGNGYSFCISSRGEGNLYFDYRHRQKGTPYFIFDDKKSSEQDDMGNFIDPDHLLVLFMFEHSYDKGTFWYTITDADNDGEVEYDDFDTSRGIIPSVEEMYPRLKGMKELFKPVEMDPKEIGEYELGIKYQKLLEDINDKFYSRVTHTYIDEDSYIGNFHFSNIKGANKDIDDLIRRKTGIYKFTAELKNPSDKVHYNDYLTNITTITYKIGEDEDLKDYYQKFIDMMKMFTHEDSFHPITTKRVIEDFDLKHNKIEGKTYEFYQKYFNDVKELVDQYRSELSKINLLSK
jgi:hypothetical protein